MWLFYKFIIFLRFQFKDATLRLNSFANLAKNNIKMIEQLIRVLERQRDGEKRNFSNNKKMLFLHIS